jgi:type IV secretory pathway VirB10-like protein
MLGLILLLAIAYACACAIDKGLGDVSAKHKKRIAKASKKKGRRTGAEVAAWAATGLTAVGTFAKGFVQGFKREWPKAKKRATAKVRGPKPATEPPAQPQPEPAPAEAEKPAAPAPASPKLVLLKNPETEPDTQGAPMTLATIPEITGVNTLKAAVARFASEAGVTAEEAGAIAQRAAEQLAAIEAAIEQAGALEFGDDGGTLQELAALRDQYAAALAAAQAMQQAAVDNAAIAAQSSKNIHSRHGGIQEAVAATGGRMASKQAYTADL